MSFEAEQIMSKDKYPSIFSRQMEAFVFIFLQIFFAARSSFDNWGISLGYFPVLDGSCLVAPRV